jgi:hypothetical protein
LNAVTEITIYINGNAFRIERQALTGQAIRDLATPPIGGDYEMYLVSAGEQPDLAVNPLEVIELNDGAQFFAAPRQIMAGQPGFQIPSVG